MQFPEGINVYGSRSFRGTCPKETQEAVAFFGWLRLQYPALGLVATHIRNEGKASKWQRFQQKKEGMVSGASDIIIPVNPALPYSRPFICEMKRKDHTQSSMPERQVDYLRACQRGGAFVCIALGADAAMDAVRTWVWYSEQQQKVMTA